MELQQDRVLLRTSQDGLVGGGNGGSVGKEEFNTTTETVETQVGQSFSAITPISWLVQNTI